MGEGFEGRSSRASNGVFGSRLHKHTNKHPGVGIRWLIPITIKQRQILLGCTFFLYSTTHLIPRPWVEPQGLSSDICFSRIVSKLGQTLARLRQALCNRKGLAAPPFQGPGLNRGSIIRRLSPFRQPVPQLGPFKIQTTRLPLIALAREPVIENVVVRAFPTPRFFLVTSLMRRSENLNLFLRCGTIDGVQRETIFWSTSKHMPSKIPPYNVLGLSEYYEPDDIQQLHWAMDNLPHLMFVPSNPRFEGPIFQRLSCTSQSLPIINFNGRWQLQPELSERWQRLEIGLIAVSMALLDGIHFSLGYGHRYPSSYGYLRSHKTDRQARKCAMKSRDGFVELIAVCSHAIALRGWPDWENRLAKRPNTFHPEWVDLLKRSIVCDFTIPRVGAIVDVARCAWIRHMYVLVKAAAAPIWFLWGLVSPTRVLVVRKPESPHTKLGPPDAEQVKSFLQGIDESLNYGGEPFEENTDEFQLAAGSPSEGRVPFDPDLVAVVGLPLRELPTPYPVFLRTGPSGGLEIQTATDPGSTSPFDSPPLHSDNATEPMSSRTPPRDPGFTSPLPFHSSNATEPMPSKGPPPRVTSNPKPFLGSGQHEGETWQEFFKRRDERNARLLAIESKLDKEIRENRLRATRSSLLPVSAKVFRWVEVDGFLLRELLFRGNVEYEWDSYCSDQRRYDPISNEWDLCEEFSRGKINYDEKDEYDDYDEYEDEDEDQRMGPQLSPPRDMPDNFLLDDLNAVYRPVIESVELQSTPFLQCLHDRYGFVWTGSVGNQVSDKSFTIQRAKSIFSDSQSSVASHLEVVILAFLSAFLQYQASQSPPPAQIWDLSSSNSCSLVRKAFNLSWTIINCEASTPLSNAQPRTLYLVKPLTRSIPDATKWLLATKDAPTALQCLRCGWGPTLEHVVRHFVEGGFPFNTLHPVPSQNLGTLRYTPPISLGYRDPGYRPSPVDYAIYEQLRDASLTPSVARAALKRGGILWRLARERYTNVEEASEIVLETPDPAESLAAQRFVTQSSCSFDDHLTSEAELLICGVYRVRIGMLFQFVRRRSLLLNRCIAS